MIKLNILGSVGKFLFRGDLDCGEVPDENHEIKPNPPEPGYLLQKKMEGSLPEKGKRIWNS